MEPLPSSAYVTALRERLKWVSELPKTELGRAQAGQKQLYDSKVNSPTFVEGQKVLLLLPKLLVQWQ